MALTDLGGSCVFCSIVAGDLEPGNGGILLHATHSVIFEPLKPVTPGHKLVVPKVHVTDFADDPKITARAAADAAWFVEEFLPDTDTNLITSRGPLATQTVYHLHLHIVPRRDGDGLALPWT